MSIIGIWLRISIFNLFSVIAVKTFVNWDFYNPLIWLMKIPSQTISYRWDLLSIILVYQIFVWVITFAIYAHNNDMGLKNERLPSEKQ